MRRILALALALAPALALTGCGTVCNNVHFMLPPRRTPFGGVLLDVEGIRNNVADVSNPKSDGRIGACLETLLWCVDLPLSAAGDTLLLPFADFSKDDGPRRPVPPAAPPDQDRPAKP